MHAKKLHRDYYNGSCRVHLECGARGCRLFVAMGTANHPPLTHAAIEFWLQGRDRAGLPVGTPVRIHKITARLLQTASQSTLAAKVWLPGKWTKDVWLACYIRILPVDGASIAGLS